MNYNCKYNFKFSIMNCNADSLEKLKDGFFIDNQNRFTESEECARYWIAPSSILYIKIGKE